MNLIVLILFPQFDLILFPQFQSICLNAISLGNYFSSTGICLLAPPHFYLTEYFLTRAGRALRIFWGPLLKSLI